MKIIAELEPSRKRDKLLSRVKGLVANVDAIDIPEVPMGRPLASAAVLSAHLQAIYPDTEFIPHVRVIDLNRVGLLSIIAGLGVAGIRETVLLRGDDPVEGSIVEDLTVEEAALLVRERLKTYPRLGAMLSMRFPIEAMEKRLEAPFDFYMVLRALHDPRKLVKVSTIAQAKGKLLYAYVIVAGSRNRELLKRMLGDQPIYSVEEVENVIDQLSGLVDGIIISSPGDYQALVEAAQKAYRKA